MKSHGFMNCKLGTARKISTFQTMNVGSLPTFTHLEGTRGAAIKEHFSLQSH